MENNNSSYYLKIGDETATLEFDLITFRQKGQEEKYLSISFNGVDITKDPPVSQEAFVNIDEDGFKAIKNFFQQLEWNK
jgi:hypothetical protein